MPSPKASQKSKNGSLSPSQRRKNEEAEKTQEGEPLQIVRIEMEENKVTVDEENLKKFERTLLSFCEKEGISKVSIVSVMGAYRTGKSFVLDLFLRYLKGGNEDDSQGLPARGSDAFDEAYTAPSWLSEGGALEGQVEGEQGGFHWRPGKEKCTEGIWVWSQPFVRVLPSSKSNPEKEKVAVLLLDTQGAWDSKMTKEQSATIFGLTAVLSSKQIYNISKQIQEDKVENLHHFMECAHAALRVHSHGSPSSPSSPSSKKSASPTTFFQSLEFLVRDWPNFEDEWTVEECFKEMKEHLDQHMDVEQVREGSTAKSIREMFDDVSCFLLPHPGLKIEKKGWGGDLEELDVDFTRFLDVYVSQKVFKENLYPKSLLGQSVTPSSLSTIISNFVKAFEDAVPKQGTFTEAMARSSNLLSKESALKGFKSELETALGPKAGQGVKEEDLEKKVKTAREKFLHQFSSTSVYGPEEEIQKAKGELEKEIEESIAQFREENRRRMERSLAVFGSVTLIAVLLYIIDKFTDVACDWYSDSCVKFSNMLAFFYCSILGVVAVHTFFLYKERGQSAAALALVELAKRTIDRGFNYAGKVQEKPGDKSHILSLLLEFGEECSAALLPTYQKVLDYTLPHLQAQNLPAVKGVAEGKAGRTEGGKENTGVNRRRGSRGGKLD